MNCVQRVFIAAFAETPNRRADAGIEPINLIRIKLQQTLHHSCAYFEINRFDESNSTKIRLGLT